MTALMVLAAVAACSCTGAQPALWFGEEDLPELRRRVETADHRGRWEAIRTQAQASCAVDPATIDQSAGDPKRPQVLGHYYGRLLCDWAETIGFAYQLTGDAALGEQGAQMLETACRRLPASDPRIAGSFAGARGDIARGLAVGYDWLNEAMTPEQKALWADTAAGYVESILSEAHSGKAWWVPHHNFVGVAVGAAGCLALELRETMPDRAPGWVDACAALIHTWFDEGFDEQGAYYEGCGYAVYGLTNATLFADALLRCGGPDLFDHPRLKRVPEFFAHSLLPGERVFDARNDSSYAGLGNPLILRQALAHGSGLARWLWEYCGGGNSPFAVIWDSPVLPQDPAAAGTPLTQHFVGRGLCVFRTGWAKEDLMLAIEAGPYYKVTHNQADKGHFTLYGLGGRWAIDSGYGNNRQPGGRDQTVAHNCVLIDGEGQALSGAGAGTNGAILAFRDSAAFGYALADATDAYNRNNHNQPGATVEHALRHALFIRPREGVPAYAVILDDIVKDAAAHEFTWLLHTADNMRTELRPAGALVHPEGASGNAFVETPVETTGGGAVTWEFEIARPGEYAVWARVRAAGEEVAKSDSFSVSVDGTAPIDWHMPGSRDWQWGRVAKGVPARPISFPLAAGKHTLRFATRELGAQVDRVIVTDAAHASLTLDLLDQEIGFEAEAGDVSGAMRVVRTDVEGGDARLVLAIDAGGPVEMSRDLYESHPRLTATATAINPRFAAVLAPLPGGTAEPRIAFERDGDAVTVRVAWEAHEDRIRWSGNGTGEPEVTLGKPTEDTRP